MGSDLKPDARARGFQTPPSPEVADEPAAVQAELAQGGRHGLGTREPEAFSGRMLSLEELVV